jgi:hypothetical protein
VLLDGDTAVLVAPAANVAEAGSITAVAPVITWTTDQPTANGAITIADGDSVTDSEAGVWIAEMELFNAAVVTDVDALQTQVDAIIAALVDAGIMTAP